MLSTNQLFLTGLRVSRPDAEPLPADLPEFLEAVSTKGKLTDNPAVAAGMVSAALDAFPGSPLWNEGLGSRMKEVALSAPLADTDPEFAMFYLGRYAYLGRDVDLLEVIRMAKHRDGSTAAIQTSTATVQMLEGAAFEYPEVATKFKSMGFDLARVQFGNFPTGAPMKAGAPLPADGPYSGNSGLYPTPAGAAAVPPAGSQISQKSPATPLQVITSHPVVKGFDGLESCCIWVGEVPVSITTALALQTSLVASIRKLMIPEEGFLWVDELDGLGGTLATVDEYQASRLKLPERTELADKAAVKGRIWEAGSVTQGKDSGSATFGLYVCTLQKSGGGTEEFGRYEDLNDAKAVVSARVRSAIAGLPA